AAMKPGALIVDVAIDQGGCIETSHETTHADPVFEVNGVLHYCVGNVPGAVPHTSTYALANATLPYLVEIATQGPERAATADRAQDADADVGDYVVHLKSAQDKDVKPR